ncbi:MAG TPA: hypothetical protein VFN63_06705 [Pseudolabrys sp.]|jgi:hypothetical protein|nr:hypothetical protein [Pseudolabrys sp.]
MVDGITDSPTRQLSVQRMQPLTVIAGLDPAIHKAVPRTMTVFICLLRLIMDARVKPAHDG